MTITTKNNFWGYHLLLDIAACPIELVTDPENIANFSRELVKRIDMTAYGEPIVLHFAEHNPEVAGWSLVQLITTSNITAHFADISGDGYIDCFSCKPFDQNVAIAVVEEFFKPERIRPTYVVRQA